MKRVLPLVLAIVVGATASSSAAAAFTIRDMAGRDVTLPAPPRRLVSLVPGVAEAIYAIGAEDRLVGVTDFCDFPPAVRGKTSIGGMINPSLETIVSLRPDVVIATRDGNREETFVQLGRLGIPIFLVGASRLRDVTDLVARLGVLTERAAAAQALVADLDRRIDTVRRAVAARRRPRVLYVVWPEPLIVPGRDALVTELIHVAGGESVTAAEPGAWPRLGLEPIVARHPEVILFAATAGTEPVDREKWDRLRTVPAIRSGRIHTVDRDLLHRYGPRVVDGLEALARAVHPESVR